MTRSGNLFPSSSARTSIAPWSMAQTVLGPLMEPLALIATGAGVRRLHSFAERRSPQTASCGWRDRATCSAPPSRWMKRRPRLVALSVPSDLHQHRLRRRDRCRPVADRHSQCRVVGADVRACCASCPMSACRWPSSFPFRARTGGGSRLDHDGAGPAPLWRDGSHHRPGDRTLPLWPQHGTFGGGGCRCRRVLDLAVGAGWPSALHAADHVFCGASAAMSRG